MKILVAEDNKDIAFGYKQALKTKGHDVLLSFSGDECLDIYKTKFSEIANINSDDQNQKYSQPFDVVILDYKMPGLDGLAVAREIYSLVPNQRIIFASAFVKDTLEKVLVNFEQVVEVLQKPFEPKALVDTIEDKEIEDALKIIMSNMTKIQRDHETGTLHPSDEQIRSVFEGLRKFQKGRTF